VASFVALADGSLAQDEVFSLFCNSFPHPEQGPQARVEGRTPDRRVRFQKTKSTNQTQFSEQNQRPDPAESQFQTQLKPISPVTSATDTYFALCEGLVIAGLAG